VRTWLPPLLYLAVLAFSVAVFLAYDSRSHSASDTLRPLVITVLPLWIAVGLLMRWVRRGWPR
jgi:hypothetical protein